MAAEHDLQPAAPTPAPAVVAAPDGAGGAPLGVETVLSLQRTAGNQAVCRAIADGRIQRQPTATASVPVTGVSVTPGKSTVPLDGTSIRAGAQPANASGVTWSLDAGTTTAAAGTSIDKAGKVTVDAKQPGGKLKAKATSDDGSWADMEFQLVEKPAAIASTSGAASGTYEAAFTHTFSGSGSGGAGLEGANVNEKFDALSVQTDFGAFSLSANASGSQGWDLDASGKMAGPDSVSIDKAMVDAQKFVKSASNPSPAKQMPVGFDMTQKLHNKKWPSGTLEGTPFATPPHGRHLDERNGKLVVVIKAGAKEVEIPYDGPTIFRNIKADKTSVEASTPKPAKGDWKRNEVQASVTAEGSGTSVSWSLVGDALGCEVDGNGKVKIGSTPGTIKVRGGDGAKRFDEISITITAPVAPPKPQGASAEPGGDAVPTATADEPPTE